MLQPALTTLALLLALTMAEASLMSRIGLRLGAKHAQQSRLDHRPRVPWAVRNIREEAAASERKPWQEVARRSKFVTRAPVVSVVCTAGLDAREESGAETRPAACVGICYYNKLLALEAKEDLTSHNDVYKDQPPCEIVGGCNEIDEDIEKEMDDGVRPGTTAPQLSDSSIIVIDDENQTDDTKGKGVRKEDSVDTIYIDENYITEVKSPRPFDKSKNSDNVIVSSPETPKINIGAKKLKLNF